MLLRGSRVYEAFHDVNFTREQKMHEAIPNPLHGASRAPEMAQGFWPKELDAQSQPDWHTAADTSSQPRYLVEVVEEERTHDGKEIRSE